MAAMKWIKLSTALFDNDKMVLLAQLRNGDALQLLWVKLLCLAGRQGSGGVFLLREGVPCTPKMLSEILRVEEKVVKQGLRIFTQYGMLTREKNAWRITNWERYQSMTAYEKKLNYDRNYHKKRREEKNCSFLELELEDV